MDEIKNCACGSEAGFEYDDFNEDTGEGDDGIGWIKCSNPDCGVCIHDERDAAINKWNALMSKMVGKKCSTCNHWAPPESYRYGEVPGIGRCMAILQYWDAAKCDEEGEWRIMKLEYSEALALVEDVSDYHASLRTFPDFGCVMHESDKGNLPRLETKRPE